MNRIIFITGATSGFGKAIAEKFAAGGDHLIITGRRKERLDAFAQNLKTSYGINVLPLNFDVQDKEAVFQELKDLPDQWKSIDILVNNAGLALGRDYFDEASLEDWETMIDTNVKGLLYVSKAVSALPEKRRGWAYHQYGLHCRKRSLRKRQRLLRLKTCRGCHQQIHAGRSYAACHQSNGHSSGCGGNRIFTGTFQGR